MKLTRQRLVQGERMPWWCGFAYNDWMSGHSYGYVIPLNLVVRIWRWLCMRCFVLIKRPMWVADDFQKVYQKGRESSADSYHQGYKNGLERGEWKGRREFVQALSEAAKHKDPDALEAVIKEFSQVP